MSERTSNCAACRFKTEPGNPRALELAEENIQVLIADLEELPRFQILVNTQGTVPLETMGPFAAILPRSNRGFDLQFHLGKTPSNRIKNLGFT